MDAREAYNLIAEDWHRDHASDDWWIEGTDAFIQKLPVGSRVLDVGCGSGVKSEYLIAHGLSLTGIDVSDKLLEIARREVPEGRFMALSMTELDSMQQTFDGVFAQASLLHIPKKDASLVVQKMAKRLVPRGFLYIAVKEAHKGRPEEEVVREHDYGQKFERFFSYFTVPELETYLVDAGLETVLTLRNQSPSGKTVWLQIIGQKC